MRFPGASVTAPPRQSTVGVDVRTGSSKEAQMADAREIGARFVDAFNAHDEAASAR
jgi:hypothetical protein